MHSLMLLHRHMMKSYTDDMTGRSRRSREETNYPGRAEERDALRNFIAGRGLDKRVKRLRQPKLKLVEDCGSEIKD